MAAINFRASSGYVTDGAGETYCLAGDTYPATRGGSTFGWDSGTQSVDRNSGIDRRLAGVCYHTVPRTFRLDLPSAGSYAIRLAFGDAGAGHPDMSAVFKDGATTLFSLLNKSNTSSQFFDALGVQYTIANWPGSNSPRTVAMAGTALTIEFTCASNVWVIAHLSVVYLGADPEVGFIASTATPFAPLVVGGAISFVSGDAASSGTTVGLNSSTANFAILHGCSWPSAPTTVVEGGGYSNTWIPLPYIESSGHFSRVWYSFLTSKGAGHTFGHNGGAPCVQVALFSGVPTDAVILDHLQVTTTSPGTVTPTSDGSLVICVGMCQSGVFSAVSGGLTIVDTPITAGIIVGGAMAYLIQGTAAAVAPAWTGGSGPVSAQTLVMYSPTPSTGLVSSVLVETLSLESVTGRVTHVLVETLSQEAVSGRVSHIVVETLTYDPEEPPPFKSGGIWMGDGAGRIWIE